MDLFEYFIIQYGINASIFAFAESYPIEEIVTIMVLK